MLEYSFDDSVSEDTRKHSFSKSVKLCSVHENIKPLSKVYTTVLEENQRKNQALQLALEKNPELADIIDTRNQKRYDAQTVANQLGKSSHKEAADELGAGLVLKEDIEYRWEFVQTREIGNGNDDKRMLEIDFDVPDTPSVERALAAKSTDRLAIRQKTVGDNNIVDKLQQELDSEFSEAKDRGKVRIKVKNK